MQSNKYDYLYIYKINLQNLYIYLVSLGNFFVNFIAGLIQTGSVQRSGNPCPNMPLSHLASRESGSVQDTG